MPPSALDAKLALALSTKLKLIFEKEDKFLSFPIGVGFTNSYLNFMKEPAKSGLTLQEHLNNKGDFARLMNAIPTDSTNFAPTGDFLWDEVTGVLHDSVFAQTALTPREEGLLDEAVDYLTDIKTDEDGNEFPVSSVKVLRYYECKEVYEAAANTFLNEKITIENTSGPEGELLRQRWDSQREKELSDVVKRAENDWVNLGFKNEVEYYQSVKSDLESKKFLLHYKQSYLDEMEVAEDFDLNGKGMPFWPTFFSPFDVFEKDLPWISLTLTRSEINTLVGDAPEELIRVFGQDEVDIESVTMEYNNVVIVRPWFRSEFFSSRYWKLSDDKLVSDGNVPRSGCIPAYISNMIVVRNMELVRKKSQEKKNIDIRSMLPIMATMSRPANTINRLNNKAVVVNIGKRPTVKARVAVPAGKTVAVAERHHMMREALTDKIEVEDHASGTRKVVAKPAARKLVFAPAAKVSLVRPVGTPVRTVVPGKKTIRTFMVKPPAAKTDLFTKYAGIKYMGTTIRAPRLTIPPRPAEPKNDNLVKEKVAFDGVIVLAYVCKRMPKSPNPDPALHFDE